MTAKRIDDPVREWGWLLAYLPDVKRRCLESGGRAILLPTPSLSSDSFHNPSDTIGIEARNRQVVTRQVHIAPEPALPIGWRLGHPADRFDRLYVTVDERRHGALEVFQLIGVSPLGCRR